MPATMTSPASAANDRPRRLPPRLSRHLHHAHRGGGRARGEVRGDPEHPFTRGGLCVKVDDYIDRVYSPDRVLYP